MVGNPRELLVATRKPTQLRHARIRPQVGLEVYNHSRHETGMNSTVTPARVARSGRAGPPPFPQGADQRIKGEHERPHPPIGRARPGSDDGRIRRTRRALFSLVGRIVPPNIPQDEEIQRRNDFDTFSTIEIHDRDQIKIRSTSIIVDHEHKNNWHDRGRRPRARPEGPQ